jgi:hypothetical protein
VEGPLVADADVHFELTKDAKFARIAALGRCIFVDDLPEILLAPAFPKSAEPILFDPDGHHAGEHLARLQHWDDLRARVEALWKRNS